MQKQHLVVHVTGDGSKVKCCKKQHYMNQGKLEVVKQEVARANIDIWRFSELKWMEWANVIQMTIVFTTVARIP